MRSLKNKFYQSGYVLHIIIGVFLVVGFIIRLYYAQNLPITNDESSYIYDTLNIRNGLIPLKDFLTKSLPFIYLLTLSQSIFGNSIIVGRLCMVLIALITSTAIFVLTRQMFNKKIAIIAGLTYWSFPLIAAYTTLVHTEPFQTLFVVISYIFLYKFGKTKNVYHLISASLAMAIAFFVRQSSLVLILLPLIFDLLNNFILKRKFKILSLYFVIVTSALIFIVTFVAYQYMGGAKTLELIGGGAVNLTIQAKSSLGWKELLLYPIKFALETIQEASNLFRDGLILSSFSFMTLVYWILGKNKKIKSKFNIYVTAFLLLIAIYSLYQFKYRLLSGLWDIDMIPHINLMSLVVLLTTLFFSHTEPRSFLSQLNSKIINSSQYLFQIVWVAVIFGIYIIWIKFRSPYLIEFFTPITILFSTGLVIIYDDISLISNAIYQKYAKIILISFVSLAFISSFLMNKYIYFTGLFLPSEVEEITTYLKTDSPGEDIVLTALAIFPYLSGDEVIYNISHPAWYGYTNIPNDIFLLYFPPIEKVLEALEEKRVKFVIREPFTNDSYFGNKKMNKILEENYTSNKVIGRATIYKANE